MDNFDLKKYLAEGKLYEEVTEGRNDEQFKKEYDPIISNWRTELIKRINKQKKLTPKQKKDLLNKANKGKSGLDFEEIHLELDDIKTIK